jgi:hypothetical protein
VVEALSVPPQRFLGNEVKECLTQMASGMHARLGAASGVSWLDEHSRWC